MWRYVYAKKKIRDYFLLFWLIRVDCFSEEYKNQDFLSEFKSP